MEHWLNASYKKCFFLYPDNSTRRSFEDLLFASLAFPMGMFVGLIFWGLYLTDRNLVFPPVLDLFIPTWVNHAMHTT